LTGDHFVGTPAYMAPEQLRNEPDLDARADVWAVGAVLYRMLADRLPYGGPAWTVIEHIGRRDPEPLEWHARHASEALCALVHGALTRDRDRRTPDMTAMLEAMLEVPELREDPRG